MNLIRHGHVYQGGRLMYYIEDGVIFKHGSGEPFGYFVDEVVYCYNTGRAYSVDGDYLHSNDGSSSLLMTEVETDARP